MSVLAFHLIQDKVVELIQADPYFVGEVVTKNVGRSLAEVESALKEQGQAVVVFPVQDAGQARNGYASSYAVASIDVRFLFNPNKGTKDIYLMVTNGIGAVLSYIPPNVPNDRFKYDNLVILQEDSGVWGYDITFTKAVQFS